MVRHVLMLKFKPEVTQEQQLKLAEMSVAALEQIPGTKNIIAGMASDIEGKPLCDGVLFVDFDDEAKLKAYLQHPVHKAAEEQLPVLCNDIKVLDCLY